MTSMEQLTEDNRKHVMRMVNRRTEEVDYRDKLDLQKSADLVKAYGRVFAEDRELYNLYRRAISVPVREVSQED